MSVTRAQVLPAALPRPPLESETPFPQYIPNYELRVVVWSTEGVVLDDVEMLSDIYVKT